MGCSSSKDTLEPIPLPQGPPKDPLQSDGDIIETILTDPHIHFFQKKLQQVILPLATQQKQAHNKQNKPITIASQTSSSFNSSTNLQNNLTNNINKNNITHTHTKLAPLRKYNLKTSQSFVTTDKKQHEKYTKSINQAIHGNDSSVTNILGFMIEEMADVREYNQVNGKFDNDAYAALKCFIYLYTGQYTYKKINSQLRRNDYQKISLVIAVVKKQLEKYNKQKFARKLKANQKLGKFLNLYRGIPKPDKLMMKGVKMYWKGFTSTSLEVSIANRFGRYNYVVELEKNTPHPYMIVPEQLSQYKQQQIILFPYFYFECLGVEDFTSGAKYQCKQLHYIQQK